MKIIITEQEAIQAWKDVNSDLRLNKETKVEIQRDSVTITGTASVPFGVGTMLC